MAHVAIVGGGPSVKHAVRELQHRARIGQSIWACNGAYAWLREHDIQPTGHVLIDARPENIRFIQPTPGVRYFLASQCDPSLFDLLVGHDVTLFHLDTPGMEQYFTERPATLIGGGTTVAMKAMAIAHVLGYDYIHLYGVDSSYEDDHHAYEQTDSSQVLTVTCAGREFKSRPWMVAQAQEFQSLVGQLEATVTVNGDGLLPHIARQICWNNAPV